MSDSVRTPPLFAALAAALLYAVLPGAFCGAMLTAGWIDPPFRFSALLPLPGVFLIPAGFFIAYLLKRHAALLSWLALVLMLSVCAAGKSRSLVTAELLTGGMVAALSCFGTQWQRFGFGAGFLLAAAGTGAGLLTGHYTPIILYLCTLVVAVYVIRVRWYVRIFLIAAIPVAALVFCRSELAAVSEHGADSPPAVAVLTAALLPDCGDNPRSLILSHKRSEFAPLLRGFNYSGTLDVAAPDTPAKLPDDRGNIRVLSGAPGAVLHQCSGERYDLIIVESIPAGTPEAKQEFFKTLLDLLAAPESVLVLPASETAALPETFRSSPLPFSSLRHTTRSGIPSSADPEQLDRRVPEDGWLPRGVYAALAWRPEKDAVFGRIIAEEPKVQPIPAAVLFRWGLWIILGYWIIRFYLGRSSTRASVFAVVENGAVFSLAFFAFYAQLQKNELAAMIPAAAWLGFPVLGWCSLPVAPRRAKILLWLSLAGVLGWFTGSSAAAAGAAWLGSAAENRRLQELPELNAPCRTGLLLAGISAGMLLHTALTVYCRDHLAAALLFFTLLFRAGALLRPAE